MLRGLNQTDPRPGAPKRRLAMTLMQFLQSPRVRRNALLAGLWLVLLGVLVSVRAVLLPFGLAAFLAYIIHPLVSVLATKQIGRVKIKRWMAVLAVYVAVIGAGVLAAAFLVPKLISEGARLLDTASHTLSTLDEARLHSLAGRLERTLRAANLPVRVVTSSDAVGTEGVYTLDIVQTSRDAADALNHWLRAQSAQLIGQVQHALAGVFRFVFRFFLVFMITAFFVVDVESVKRFAFALVPTEDRAAFDAFLGRVDHGLSGVVRGQLLICLINGVLTLIGLLIGGVKYAFVLGTLAGVFSLVPIFGSIMSTVPIVVVALTQSWQLALFALVWILVIHAVEANFLNPKILGDSTRIHPVVIVLALLSGEHAYGIVGALFAVPLTSIGVTVFKSVLARVAVLQERLASEPGLVDTGAPDDDTSPPPEQA